MARRQTPTERARLGASVGGVGPGAESSDNQDSSDNQYSHRSASLEPGTAGERTGWKSKDDEAMSCALTLLPGSSALTGWVTIVDDARLERKEGLCPERCSQANASAALGSATGTTFVSNAVLGEGRQANDDEGRVNRSGGRRVRRLGKLPREQRTNHLRTPVCRTFGRRQ